jgi:hypothetical protein
MAGYLERKATDIAHPINVLEDAGLLHRTPTRSATTAPPTASPSR